MSTDPRQEFCLALKTARERKGITLDEIADTTKIPAFMFAALEQCDLSRWPKGLFRRSFFRDYVQMLSLPVPEACAEFVRLFPDDEGVDLKVATAAVSSQPSAAAALWSRIAGAISRIGRQISDDRPEPVQGPHEATWVTDARRVAPRRSRQFRVRIKLPR